MTSHSQQEPVLLPIGNSEQIIEVAPSVLKTFSKFTQVSSDSCEAGGLLFAKFDLPHIHLIKATRPSRADRRSRLRIQFSTRRRASIIKREFRKGLHFIGEWHTHPEPEPRPSSIDLTSMRNLYALSTHELNYFVMVIVGNSEIDPQLWVSIHNSNSFQHLNPSM